MSAISKYWYEIVTPAVTCESLTHPGLTCRENLGIQLRKTVPGNLQFFGPISVLRMVLLMYTRNQVSWAVVLQALYECGMAALNGWFVSNSWTAMFCVLYRLLGQRFVNNWSVSLPALAGTLAMFWMPSYVKMSHSRAIFNVVRGDHSGGWEWCEGCVAPDRYRRTSKIVWNILDLGGRFEE